MSEGYFGTLPDGLLMYLHRTNVENINVTGIGYPIKTIEAQHKTMANQYQKVLLVGNSHRLQLDLKQATLLSEYCRPFNAPCHQVWDVTDVVKN